MQSDSIFSLWPIPPFGGEDKDEPKPADSSGNDSSGGQSNSSGNKGNSNQGQGSNPQGTPGDSTPSSDDDDDPYAGLTAKELRRLLNDSESKANKSESERKALQDKVDEADRATRTKEENLQKDLDKERNTNSVLRATNSKLAITNAILLDTRFQWHNPEIVAQQLNPEVVKVGDDGKVEGMAKELARVAKEHDYLLKSKGGQQQSNTGPTGFQPGQGGATQGGTMEKNAQELAKTFPALATRI